MANIKLSNKILSKVFFACFAVFLLVPFGAKLEAATMSLVSSSLSVDVGGIFTLKAFVDTQQKYINNAEATISFSPDLVEVVSVSGKDSIFSLWVEQPTFSNINGQITFNGGVVNPGFIGSRGEAVSAVFRAKKSGTANFLLSGVAIRENDGLGTNILTNYGSAVVTIKFPTTQPSPTVPVQEEIPGVPQVGGMGTGESPTVSSPTCPDQNLWCSSKKVVFTWDLPEGATAVQTLLGKNPDSIPTITYDSPIIKKEVDNLGNGVLYFHIRYKDGTGWSKTS
ncbi:MAG TPA: hypothetical protein PK367_01890, partial [Candidatus Paceibacterota bacterium]|nr:hypothetical protein [Candidatus Paceibacterota bacterium]